MEEMNELNLALHDSLNIFTVYKKARNKENKGPG
jgi:hypothetical protein